MKILSILLLLCAAVWFVPPASAQNSNTIVRIHFYRGATVIGDVDVELFDQDKPVTVSNFLSYVRGGFYKNLWIHRCIPRFVVQSGAYWTPVPQSTGVYRQDFEGFTPNFGSITNEFDVGPRLSNTFGTIAMARVGGETNSANSQWFFNLADNSAALDTHDGGFTVFGRVLGATNALDFFNHPSSQLRFLDEVPASVSTRIPRWNELYHLDVSVLPLPTNKPPVVTITSPAQNARFSNSTITVTGTASDDQTVSTILYSIRDRPLTNASGAAVWSIEMEAAAGTNLITVFSLDNSGQRSVATTRTIFRSVPEPLNLTINGSGTIVGATNGQRFELERTVTLTAKPAPGHLFAGWSGSFTYVPAGVRFFMFPDASLTATFVTNPFPPMKGNYSGLFYNTNFSTLPSGALTFSVTDLGKVSGKLNVAGRSLPFSGGLSPYGEANLPVSLAPLLGVRSNWFVAFTLDVTNQSDRVFGPNDNGANSTGYPYVWDQNTFTTPLIANRVRVGTAANPSPYAGKYTLAIPGGADPTLLPEGDSYGAVTVSASGAAKVVGTLADGTAFTASAPVTTNGLWPLYTGLYGVRGWLFGWVTYDFNDPADDLHGEMRWRKVGFSGKPYPNGFEMLSALGGSRYTTATSTHRVLDLTYGVVTLTGPNLAAPSTNDVLLTTNNLVLNLDTNRLILTLAKPSGLFSGTVTPVGGTRSISFKGALLPKQNYGAGFYLSTNLSGRVYFGE